MKASVQLRSRWFLTVATFLLAVNVWAGDECKLPDPTIINQAPHQLLQTWTMDDTPILWSEQLPNNVALTGFQMEIKKRVDDLDPYSVLQREYDDFIRSNDPLYLAEGAKIKLVIAKYAGVIRPMNCLEAALFSVQLERQSMIEQPSEFGAFILRNGDASHPKLKIYYATWDRPGGKVDSALMDRVDADLSAGWVLWRHLHNHNFFFQHPISVMGGVCPSKPDVGLYLDLQRNSDLRSAAITNGFSTLELNSDDFIKLDVASPVSSGVLEPVLWR